MKIILRLDNGSQYISKEFKSAMKYLGITIEHIKKQTPEDNGDIGSFHNSLKTDYIWPYKFDTYDTASTKTEEAFQDYNKVRPYSTILFFPSSEFKKRWDGSEDFRNEYTKHLLKIEERKGVEKIEKGG